MVYQEILEGRGFGVEDARPSITLAHDIRIAVVTGPCERSHPLVRSS